MVILEQFQLDGFPALEAAVEASAVDAAKITELEALEMLDEIDFDGVDATNPEYGGLMVEPLWLTLMGV